MDCHHCRFALSSRVDGEPSGIRDVDVDTHLLGCDGCQGYARAVLELRERADEVDDGPYVSRSADLLGAMAVVRQRQSWWAGAVRSVLAVVALIQLALALPVLLLGEGAGVSTHLARHLGAWDVALAIGFLVAAVQPVRVIGLLPMAMALAGCMLLATVLDVVGGGHPMTGEAVHVLELAGLALLWTLSRQTPKVSTGRLRLWSPA